MLARSTRVLSAVAGVLSLAATAYAQCSTHFVPGEGSPGANGHVLAAITWDPDGAGPAGMRLVIGGGFTVAGDTAALGVASHDLVTGEWAQLGSGLDGEVVALVVDSSNQVIAGVNASSTSAANRVVAWNGSSWTQLGPDFSHRVNCLLPLPNGDLVVGGDFTSIGSTPSSRLARWDGSSWAEFGGGAAGPVRAAVQMPNGDIVVGGTFSQVANVLANCVARWDGIAWSPLGSGMGVVGIDGPYAFAVAPNGDLIAAGFFPAAGGVFVGNVARWDGSTWSGFGNGITSPPLLAVAVRSVLALPSGEIVVGGRFSSTSGVQVRSIARWNGSSWAAIGPGFQPIASLTPATVSALILLPSGEMVAGGRFTSGNGQVGDNLSRWDGASWSSFAGGFNGSVRAIAESPSGEIVVAGTFSVAGGVSANRVARWDGSIWGPLGTGADSNVHAIAVMPGGDVVIGGAFTSAGGVAANRVARWNGAVWAPMGAGMNNDVTALGLLANGDLVAGGPFTTADGLPAARLARWTGIGWVELAGGVSGLNPTVTAMHVRPDGSLVVGGRFSTAGTVPVVNMASWDGVAWTALGSAPSMPYAITGALGGAIVACHTSWASQWTGGAWSPLGLGATSNIFGVAGLPNGDVIAVGAFDLLGPPYTYTLGVGRWGASGWSAVGGGLDDGLARTVRVLRNGDVVIGGEFQKVGGVQSPWFARIVTTCPAVAAPLGAGCPSSGGGNTLLAEQLAWLGGVFRARSAGVPALAFVATVTGFSTTSLPLSAVLPQGQAGCTLHVIPDVLDFVLSVGGVADASFAIPNTASLVGQSFHHQHVPIEVDAGGAIHAVTATNALTLTIGAF